MQIALVIFDDFTDLDFVLHWDLLQRAKAIGGCREWRVRVLGTKPAHLSTFGLSIPTSGGLEQLREAEGVLLCSGRGTRALLQDGEYLERLALDPRRQWIGAQCSGSLLLGAKGLLSRVRVSAYPPILDQLEKFGSSLVKEGFVADGRIATASGCLAGPALSEWLIRSLAGEEVAQRVMSSVAALP
jgi:transcriptional regulator GlxA family with amidase domain